MLRSCFAYKLWALRPARGKRQQQMQVLQPKVQILLLASKLNVLSRRYSIAPRIWSSGSVAKVVA
jgi:hypothetical protein